VKNIELDEFDPTPYVNRLLSILLILTLNPSRERIKRLNDFKIRLDRVGSFLKDLEQVRMAANLQPFEVFTLPGRFHMESIWNGVECPHSMDCSMDYFLAGSPLVFLFHIHYGFHMECPWNTPFHMIPWTSPYGIHMESMEFPMNLNSKSMYYSIRIPWIPWTIPHGFHGTVHMDSMDHSIGTEGI